jgi:hypothetical protein
VAACPADVLGWYGVAGYAFVPQAAGLTGATLAVHANSSVGELAALCGMHPGCKAFTTLGALLSDASRGAALASGAPACAGLYQRFALAGAHAGSCVLPTVI